MNVKIGFRQLVNRLTGFSTPIFSLSWNPPESESQVAEHVITFIEDHRVVLPRDVIVNFLVLVKLASESDPISMSPITDLITEIRYYLTKEYNNFHEIVICLRG